MQAGTRTFWLQDLQELWHVRNTRRWLRPLVLLLVACSDSPLSPPTAQVTPPAGEEDPPPPPLSPPKALRCAGNFAPTIDCSWIPQSDIAQTQVYRNDVLVTTLNADAAGWTDGSVTSGASYTYKLRARNPSTGALSSFGAAVTATASPEPPTGLSCTAAGSFSVSCAWSNGEPGDTVEVNRQGTTGLLAVGVTAPGIVQFTDTTLSPGSSYAFQVRHRRGTAVSALSSSSTATTQTAPPGSLACAGNFAPTVDCSWSNTSSTAEVQIFRNDVLQVTLPAGATAWTDPSVSRGTTNTYKARYLNTSSFGPALSVQADPVPPSTLDCTAQSATSFRCTWTNGEPGDTTLLFEGTQGPFGTGSNWPVAPGATSHTVTGLQVGTAYTFQTRHRRNSDLSASSNAVTVLATSSVAPPTGLSCSGNFDPTMNCSWTNTVVSAQLQVARNDVVIATLPAGTTTWTDPSATRGTTYSYKLRAVDNAGVGPYGAALNAVAQPSTPSGLACTSPARSTVQCTWVNGEPSEQTEILRVGFFAPGSAGVVAAGVTSFSEANLAASTTFTYQVRHRRGGDVSGTSANATATTPAAAAAPSAPTCSGNFDPTMDCSWTNAVADAQVQVLRGGAVVATLPAGTTSWSDAGLTRGTSYTYQVRHVDGTVPGNTSATATSIANPTPPSGLACTALSATSFRCTWANGEPGETTHLFTGDPGPFGIGQGWTAAAGATSYTVTGLQVGTTYTFQARHRRNTDVSANSNSVTALATSNVAPPTGLSCSGNFDPTMNCSWTNTVATAQVQVLRNGAAVATLPAGTTAWTDPNATRGTSFAYQLRAVDNMGVGPTGTTLNVVAQPTAPSVLACTTPARSTVQCSWTNGEPTEQTEILRTGTFGQVSAGVVSAGVTTFTEANLAASTAFPYQVRHRRGSDVSGSSPTVTVTTLAAAPAPSAPACNGNFDPTMDCTWTNAVADAQVQVLRGGTVVATLPAGTTSWSDAGLTRGTSYGYQVRHVDGTVPGTSSATVTSRADPLAPSALSCTALSATSFRCTWTNGEPGETTHLFTGDPGPFGIGQGWTAAAGATSYTVTGLQLGTTYTFQARHRRNTDVSANSNSVTVLASSSVAPPTALSCSGNFDPTMNCSWTNAVASAQVQVARNDIVVATLAAGTTAWTDPNATRGTTYSYKVRAADNAGVGAYGATLSVVAQPSTPSGLSCSSPARSTAQCAWVNGEPGEQTEILRMAPSQLVPSSAGTVGAGVTTFSEANLAASTTFTYQVRHRRGSDVSGTSANATATTPAAAPAPTALTCAGNFDPAIDCTWTNAVAVPVQVLRDGAVVATLPAGTTSWSDAGLTRGTSYSYQVQHLDGSVPGVTSAAATSLADPVPPSTLACTSQSATSFRCTWTNGEPGDSTLLFEGTQGPFGTGSNWIVVPGATSHTVTGMQLGTAYTFQAKHRRNSDASAVSNSVTVTATSTVAPPSGLSCSGNFDPTMNCSWTNTVASAQVQVFRDAVLKATLPAGTTSWTDAAATRGTSYAYQLRAVDNIGVGPFGTSITVVAQPTAPSGLACTPSQTSAQCTWTSGELGEQTEILRTGGLFGQTVSAGTVGAGVVTFTTTGLSPNTGYTFSVRHRRGSDVGPSSSSVNVTTLP